MTATKEASNQQFEGKVVVITGGGAQGIGRAIAGRFHEAGATVCLVDRDVSRRREGCEGYVGTCFRVGRFYGPLEGRALSAYISYHARGHSADA
jgi:NAD(P)-dependent dehydrogenase (short-subunit alcohol dehydrogenase family)